MTGQNQLAQAINTLKDVANHSSTTDKQRILKAGDNPYLREILFYTYNKYLTYRVKQIIDPDRYAEVQPDTMYEFKQLCENLAAHKWGTNEALDRIKKFLALNTSEGADVFKNALLRDIRAGIDVKSVNKAFAGLVPVFNIQLGHPLDDWNRIKFPIAYDEKIDEIRCVAINDGETVKFFSKQGFEFETGMDAFAEQITEMAPGYPNVFDAGFRAFKFNPNNKTCVKHKNGNWQFEYAKSLSGQKTIDPAEIREFFKLHIWDVVDYEHFTTQGARGKKDKLEDRKIHLHALFQRTGKDFPNLEEVTGYIAHTKQDIDAFMAKLKLERREGVMLKPLDSLYTFGKNWNLMKLKHFVEADFRIVGAYEGEAGKKYEGLLGGVSIALDDGKLSTDLGTGFSDEDRAELWLEYLNGRLVGRIVEVQLKDITADGKVQLPSLLRFREDKNTTDTLEDVQAKLNIKKHGDE